MNVTNSNRGCVRDDDFRRQWFLDSGPRCHVCGIPWWQAMKERFPEALYVHHLVGGAGRSDEAANLLILCSLCHSCYHTPPQVWRGEKWPALTMGMLLRVKAERQPKQFDLARLLALTWFTSAPPSWEEVDLPERFQKERRTWVPSNVTQTGD